MPVVGIRQKSHWIAAIWLHNLAVRSYFLKRNEPPGSNQIRQVSHRSSVQHGHGQEPLALHSRFIVGSNRSSFTSSATYKASKGLPAPADDFVGCISLRRYPAK